MNIFKKIPASIYSPSFYKKIPGSSLGSALGYFFFLMLLIMVFFVALTAKDFKKFTPQIKDFEEKAVQMYPTDLVVNINKGEVSINKKEPYFIDYEGEHALVIDTKTPYSSAKFLEYGTFAWVSKDTIFYKNNNNEIKTLSLAEAKDFKLDRNFVETLKTKVDPYVPYILPAILAFLFVFMYIFYSFRLVYNFFLAFLIWLILKISKKNVSYGDSYKIGIYAMTLAFIVDLAVMFLGWHGFSFMFTLISLGVVIANFFGPNLVVDRHK